jgi:hypothetical protein
VWDIVGRGDFLTIASNLAGLSGEAQALLQYRRPLLDTKLR